MDGAVEEGEDGGGPEGEAEAARDVEDAVVEVEDGGFDADGGGLVDHFDGEEALWCGRLVGWRDKKGGVEIERYPCEAFVAGCGDGCDDAVSTPAVSDCWWVVVSNVRSKWRVVEDCTYKVIELR